MARPDGMMPQRFYHGTSLHSWKKDIRGNGALYLVTDAADAWQYAYEEAARDEEEGRKPQPIVVFLDAGDVVRAFNNGLSFGPDDGAYGYHKGMAWATTLREFGSVTLRGSASKIKRLPWKQVLKEPASARTA